MGKRFFSVTSNIKATSLLLLFLNLENFEIYLFLLCCVEGKKKLAKNLSSLTIQKQSFSKVIRNSFIKFLGICQNNVYYLCLLFRFIIKIEYNKKFC